MSHSIHTLRPSMEDHFVLLLFLFFSPAFSPSARLPFFLYYPSDRIYFPCCCGMWNVVRDEKNSFHSIKRKIWIKESNPGFLTEKKTRWSDMIKPLKPNQFDPIWSTEKNLCMITKFSICFSRDTYDQKAEFLYQLGVPIPRSGIGRLMRLVSLRNRHRFVFDPLLQQIPIDTFVNGISVWCGILVMPNPVEWHDSGVEFAHEILPDIVDAVLIMSFVHLRYTVLGGLDFRRKFDIMILPNVMQAMNGVGTHCCSKISATRRSRVLDRCQIMADSDNVVCRDADLTVW